MKKQEKEGRELEGREELRKKRRERVEGMEGRREEKGTMLKEDKKELLDKN